MISALAMINLRFTHMTALEVVAPNQSQVGDQSSERKINPASKA
jgi:hypothetical protein